MSKYKLCVVKKHFFGKENDIVYEKTEDGYIKVAV